MAKANKDKDIVEFLKKCTFSCEDIKNRSREPISISPTIDYLFGGGIKEGSFTIITGKQKTGKTSLCMSIGAVLQKHGYTIVYIDGEHRGDERDIYSIKGMDTSPDKFQFITSAPGNILTAERALSAARHKIEESDKVVVIVDSFSQLAPSEFMSTDYGDSVRDPVPKMLSLFTKQVAPGIALNKNILLGITHEVSNTGGTGRNTKSEVSGVKIQYAADFKLRATWGEPWVENEIQVGIKSHWHCITSALGPPNRKAEGYIRFGHGIDKAAEIFNLLQVCQHPICKKNSSWYSFNDDTYKAQGENKAIELIRNNPDLYKECEQAVWERLGDRMSLDTNEDDGTE